MGNGTPMKNKIKVFRAMNDLTQDNLAHAIGVNRQTILAIEKGNMFHPLILLLELRGISR